VGGPSSSLGGKQKARRGSSIASWPTGKKATDDRGTKTLETHRASPTGGEDRGTSRGEGAGNGDRAAGGKAPEGRKPQGCYRVAPGTVKAGASRRSREERHGRYLSRRWQAGVGGQRDLKRRRGRKPKTGRLHRDHEIGGDPAGNGAIEVAANPMRDDPFVSAGTDRRESQDVEDRRRSRTERSKPDKSLALYCEALKGSEAQGWPLGRPEPSKRARNENL